jgi:hypothetical protein
MTISVSRRTALRGLGVSLGLPWLESLTTLSVGAATRNGTDNGNTPPRRMACLFVPNGVHLEDWTPSGEGYGFQLPYILEPLSKVQSELLVLSGLTHDKGRGNGDGPGDHARSASVFLTGAQPRKTSGANIRSGLSVDQAAASQIGGATKFPSLELGCEAGRGAGNCDSGYSCAYSSNIAWSSSSSPVGKETNPRLVFQRLFADRKQGNSDEAAGRRALLRKSVLDFVSDDAQRLQRRLAGDDVRKVDEYMTGLREIERRIELAERETIQGGDFEYSGPAGTPTDYKEHIRLMCDMIVLAFQTDSTRVATFMLANAGSNRSYREIGVSDGHHNLSHHGGDRKKHEKIRKINRFHVEQLAYLLERLKSIREGEKTLLDSCMVLYGSGLSDGNRHNNENLPIVLAGQGGGSIDTGRHVRFSEETPLCNLFLSLLDRMGAPTDFIGDSTGRLSRLEA